MRTFVVASMLAAAVSPAGAEAVRVLSGEHDDFTRLVMVFEQPIQWEESETPRGFEVRFDRSNISPDLSRVFDRIPRKRIQSVDYDAGAATLRVQSSCNCRLDVFQAGKNTVAIDIQTVGPGTREVKPEEHRIETGTAFPFGPPGVGSGFGTNGTRTMPLSGALPKDVKEDDSQRQSLRPRTVSFETMLLEHLTRAASSGLADLERTSDSPDTVSPGSDETGLFANIAARNAFELANATVPDVSGMASKSPVPEMSCLEANLVDPGAWADVRDPASVLSGARLQLAESLGNNETEAIQEMAWTYLALGFGAEADLLARTRPGDFSRPQLIRELAGILDDGSAGPDHDLRTQQPCNSAGAVWAALADPQPGALPDLNVTAVRKWFATFPAHLRRQLGPTLEQRLLKAGHAEAADAIRQATRRAMPELAPSLLMSDAQTDIRQGRTDAALRKLETVIDDADETSATALAALLNATPMGAARLEQIELAEALAVSHTGTDLEMDLLRAAIRAWSGLGDFKAAMASYERLRARTGPKIPDHDLSGIAIAIVQREDDPTLLAFTTSDRVDLGAGNLTHEAVISLSERLLALRLPVLANRLLGPFRTSEDLRFRQLRAEAAFQLGEPALAISLVAGESDDLSRAIRAKLLSALGDHLAASRLYEALEDSEAAAREVWLSGDPSGIRALGTESEKSLAALRDERIGRTISAGSIAPADGAADGLGKITLAESRRVLDTSSQTRTAIIQLMSETDL